MENLTDEQLIEMSLKFFPNVPKEKVIEIIEQLRDKIPEITNEQIMFIAAEQLKGKGQVPTPETPTEPQGRFSHLKGMIRGK